MVGAPVPGLGGDHDHRLGERFVGLRRERVDLVPDLVRELDLVEHLQPALRPQLLPGAVAPAQGAGPQDLLGALQHAPVRGRVVQGHPGDRVPVVEHLVHRGETGLRRGVAEGLAAVDVERVAFLGQ